MAVAEMTPSVGVPIAQAPTLGAAVSPLRQSVSAASRSSDEELLRGVTGETPALPAEAEAAEKPASETEEPKAKVTEEKESEDKPIGEVAEPGTLKEVFKAHPELRSSYYAEKAYREVFPTVGEARELKELFPTLEDAKQAQTDAQLAAQLDESYRADPHGFLESLHESDKEAFQALAKEFPQFLYAVSPDTFRAARQRDLEDVLANTRDLAIEQQDENLKNAVDVLAYALWGRTLAQAASAHPYGGRHDPRFAELDRREQALAKREQEARTADFEAFYQAANAGYVEQAVAEIEQQVKQLLPAATPGAIQRIVRESWNALDENMRGNRALVADVRARLEAVAKGGRGSASLATRGTDQAKQELVDLLVKRARQAMPTMIRNVVSQWTRDVLSANREQLAKQEQAAARKDIGAGGGGAVPPRPAPSRSGRRMTDQEIMAQIP
jgi:hypothetical protein